MPGSREARCSVERLLSVCSTLRAEKGFEPISRSCTNEVLRFSRSTLTATIAPGMNDSARRCSSGAFP